MAAIDFPNSPVNGQVFNSGSLSWTYQTGVGWLLNNATGGGGFTFAQDAVPTATAMNQTWFQTSTGDSYVWINDGNSTQWVQFAPGSGGGSGGSGFTFVTDVAPTPVKVGDTWFDLSTAATGGTSWVAVEESPGGEKVWVQFAPGSQTGVKPNDVAWGLVCRPAVVIANQAGITATPTNLTGFTQTFDAIAGRMYECVWNLTVYQDVVGNAIVRASIDGTQIVIATHGTTPAGQIAHCSGSFTFYAGTAGQAGSTIPSLSPGNGKVVSFNAYASAGASFTIGSATWNNGRMSIKDVGPII